jgi:hypothetical protein
MPSAPIILHRPFSEAAQALQGAPLVAYEAYGPMWHVWTSPDGLWWVRAAHGPMRMVQNNRGTLHDQRLTLCWPCQVRMWLKCEGLIGVYEKARWEVQASDKL